MAELTEEEVPSSRASLGFGPKPYPDLLFMGSASQEEDMEVGQEEGWGRGHSQGLGAQERGAGGVAVSKGI